MIILYIAGPMTGHDDYNRPAFHQAAAQLRAAGYHVISPAETPQPAAHAEWADWTRASLKRMLDADAVALLPGWQASRGANLEVHVAAKLGMDYRSVAYWLNEPPYDSEGAEPWPERAWLHETRGHNGPEKLTPHFSIHQDGRIEQHLPVGGEDQAQRTPPPIPAATAAAASTGTACPCDPNARHHYDPACPDYCAACNYQEHVCPGCGTDLLHGQTACRDCKTRATHQEEN